MNIGDKVEFSGTGVVCSISEHWLNNDVKIVGVRIRDEKGTILGIANLAESMILKEEEMSRERNA
jgi:anti-anti-sigma regulatory factor